MPNPNLPINNLLSPWVLAVVTLFALILIFLLTPTLADRANTAARALSRWFYDAAKAILAGIKNQWTLRGPEEQRVKAKAKQQVQKEIEGRSMAREQVEKEINQLDTGESTLSNDARTQRREQLEQQLNSNAPLTPEGEKQRQTKLEKLYGDDNLGGGVIATAWARRFFYLILVLVCVFSDYVLVSTRAPILFGGGKTPDFLVALFGYLQIITGALFVSVAGLSGMLFEEYVHESLPPVVRIDPDIPLWFKRTKLIISAAMFILDIVVVIILTLLGVAKQYNEATYDVEYYAVFIGASLLIAIGIFLAWSGLTQALTGLGWLIFGSILALACAILGLICALLAGIFAALAALNLWIFGRSKGGNDPQPVIDKRTLAIIGYGSDGSDFAVRVCEQVSQIYGRFTWLAGYYTPENDKELSKRLTKSRVTENTIVVDSNESDGARALTGKLQRYYAPKYDVVKPLLWIVQDDDLGDCLDALQELEQATRISNVDLMIVWLVSGNPSKTRAALATRLNQWANDTSARIAKANAATTRTRGLEQTDADDVAPARAMLATTLVIENTSPLNDTVGISMDDVLARSVASLIVPDTLTKRASFAGELMELRNGGSHFVSLAAGAIGINTAPLTFREGTIAGQAGQINPIQASATLEVLADEALKGYAFETVTDRPSSEPSKPAATSNENNLSSADAYTAQWEAWKKQKQQEQAFVHLVAPIRLRLLKEYKGFVSKWLQSKYGVSQDHISVTRSWQQADKGIDIHIAIPKRRGEYYLHFTALRGVGDGGTATPKALMEPPA